jgi:hypothetical protein
MRLQLAEDLLAQGIGHLGVDAGVEGRMIGQLSIPIKRDVSQI